jgi:hypothetical protein
MPRAATFQFGDFGVPAVRTAPLATRVRPETREAYHSVAMRHQVTLGRLLEILIETVDHNAINAAIARDKPEFAEQ